MVRNLTAELILKPCERCPSQVSLRGEACSLAFGRDLRTSEERLECSEEFAEVRLGARMHDPLLRKEMHVLAARDCFLEGSRGHGGGKLTKRGCLTAGVKVCSLALRTLGLLRNKSSTDTTF